MGTKRAVLLALVAVAAIQARHFYPVMPETMASHFGASGAADGFQSRDGFFLAAAATLGLTLLSFLGTSLLMRRLPSRYFSLPHRDHWFSPEREAETREELAGAMEVFGAATLLFLVAVLQLVYEANLAAEPRLSSGRMWAFLGGYTAFTLVWLVRLVRRFRHPRPRR